MTSPIRQRKAKDDDKKLKTQLFAPLYFYLYDFFDNIASYFWWKYERELR